MTLLSVIKFLPQIIMFLCVLAYTVIYLVGIKNGKVKPVLATWIFFSFATFLSIVTNFKESGVQGLLANSYNLVDTLSVFVICLVIIFKKDSRKVFNKFERWCLGSIIFIFIAWLITGQNILAHLAIQAILIIAYLPTLLQLWKATENTESIGMWSLNCVASSFGLVEPIKTMSFLPIVYGSRSVISTFIVVVLILRLKYKNKS